MISKTNALFAAAEPRTAEPFVTSHAEALEGRTLMSTTLALVSRDTLLFFDSATPGVTLAKIRVTGLQKKESLVGIDFRATNDKLYAVGDSNRLYTIDTTTGVATAVGAPFQIALDGKQFGVDFNPVPDRLRVISNTGQNFRINPDTGAVVDSDDVTPGVQPDTPLAYVPGDPGAGSVLDVAGLAYSNNVAGASSTTAYDLDATRGAYLLQGSPGGTPNSPNTGLLTTFGSVGVNFTDVNGFDIQTTGGVDTGLAALNTSKRSNSGLYSIGVTTGAATLIGPIKGGKQVHGLAIAPTGSRILAVDKKNGLYQVDSVLPGIVLARTKVRGLGRGEKITGIDVRPSTDAVFAITTGSRVYSIDPTSGVATAVGRKTDPALSGKAAVGIAFDPVADQLHVVSTNGQNFRVDPTSGAVIDTDLVTAGTQPDGTIAYAAGDPNVTRTVTVAGLAASNNFSGATTSTLYAIDTTNDVLATLGSADGATVSPATGQLFTVGSLGVDAENMLGFDIISTNAGTPTNAAIAAFRPGGKGAVQLYSIDLTTGAATSLGLIGGKKATLSGLTVLAP